ncbi:MULTISPECIES: type II toxin-antitoxin system RelE/ParE family toxin [unclassified Pseudomonas]|uniref:type II toxin-antitoxin system RelE/ParE family toxin n=1 Tax=unclassified Pseudomonas TaxID=196821 RepID=UPI000A1FE40E|nr:MULTISPECIES: type II toxin-antitoxin system RelE/ParE family toxin [unclassified Pseudomonas]MDI2144329.1 type II toxin-antitoxin system RelE/ParE family toxin [Pseudomonas sp. ITA]
MKLVWRQKALDDRDNIMERIGQENPVAAIELDEVFELKGESARKHPAIYRKGIAEGTREIVVTPNYVIIYTIKVDVVEVLRVLHTRRQWP